MEQLLATVKRITETGEWGGQKVHLVIGQALVEFKSTSRHYRVIYGTCR